MSQQMRNSIYGWFARGRYKVIVDLIPDIERNDVTEFNPKSLKVTSTRVGNRRALRFTSFYHLSMYRGRTVHYSKNIGSHL